MDGLAFILSLTFTELVLSNGRFWFRENASVLHKTSPSAFLATVTVQDCCDLTRRNQIIEIHSLLLWICYHRKIGKTTCTGWVKTDLMWSELVRKIGDNNMGRNVFRSFQSFNATVIRILLFRRLWAILVVPTGEIRRMKFECLAIAYLQSIADQKMENFADLSSAESRLKTCRKSYNNDIHQMVSNGWN